MYIHTYVDAPVLNAPESCQLLFYLLAKGSSPWQPRIPVTRVYDVIKGFVGCKLGEDCGIPRGLVLTFVRTL